MARSFSRRGRQPCWIAIELEDAGKKPVADALRKAPVVLILAEDLLLLEDPQQLEEKRRGIDCKVPQRRAGHEESDLGDEIAGVDRMPNQRIRAARLDAAVR